MLGIYIFNFIRFCNLLSKNPATMYRTVKEQWFFEVHLHHNHLESLLKHSFLGFISRYCLYDYLYLVIILFLIVGSIRDIKSYCTFICIALTIKKCEHLFKHCEIFEFAFLNIIPHVLCLLFFSIKLFIFP